MTEKDYLIIQNLTNLVRMQEAGSAILSGLDYGVDKKELFKAFEILDGIEKELRKVIVIEKE